MRLRWGICGAGHISTDFVIGVSVLPDTEHQVLSIAARDLSRAREFAKKHKIINAYGSYEELAADLTIDIVYIGVILPYHYEITKLMLNSGKHVLCEKPLGMSRKQVQEMVDLARAKNVFLMEEVKSRFFPIYKELVAKIDEGTIGEPVQVTAQCCYPRADSENWKHRETGGGAALGLSSHCIQLALLVFKEPPETVKAIGHLNEEGVDLGTSVCMKFSGGRMLSFTVDLRYRGSNSAIIQGSCGRLELPNDFLGPDVLVTPSGTLEIPHPFPTHTDGRPTTYDSCPGMSYVADAVRHCIIRGQTECQQVTLNESLMMAAITDQILEQIGVSYDVAEQGKV
jgi:dihydrodiol dehydrogenase / D-xylose 1-dehydrogenase (NADP)